jgi:UDP-N-acetylglucosamine 1-carboxyvinyltransferase
VIQEGVFQARFLHVSELNRMGARIELQGNTAVVTGVEHLVGADVSATDLRAGAALILAGLAAKDETCVYHIGHVWRGYEDMDKKLQQLGGQVEIMPTESVGTKVNGAVMKEDS